MSGTHLVISTAAAAAVLWVGLAAQQEVLPRPGPGSGLTHVNVVNRASVAAEQAGNWEVAISRMPDVRIANTATVSVQLPRFALRGTKYLVTWPTGQEERISISEPGEDGWVQVENAGRSGKRWVNLGAARAIEEVK
jgi:hypothetical protein